MKPHHFALVVGFLSLMALILLFGGKPQSDAANKAALQPPRTVTVTGEGEVRVKPDMVMVTVGIWTHGASAADAEALNRAFVKRVEAAMVSAGADPDRFEVTKDTVTTTTQLEEYEGGPPMTGYETRSSLKAVVKNPTRSQAVAEAALGAGATSLESVTYGLQSPEEAKRTAMKQALENARERAAALVKSEGESLSELRSMEVLPSNDPTPAAATGGTLLFRAEVRATFTY